MSRMSGLSTFGVQWYQGIGIWASTPNDYFIRMLHVPFRRTSFDKRSLALQHHLSGTFPVSVQNCDMLTLFKSRLKAHLFSSVYACPVCQRLWSHGNMALYKFCIVLLLVSPILHRYLFQKQTSTNNYPFLQTAYAHQKLTLETTVAFTTLL